MQAELELLQPQLVVAAAENEKMLIVIERESKEVETTSEKVRGEEAHANVQAAASQALKEECEADLAEAIPALTAALSALDTLKVILLSALPSSSCSYVHYVQVFLCLCCKQLAMRGIMFLSHLSGHPYIHCPSVH